MDGDQDALIAARFSLTLALEIATDDEGEQNAQRVAQVAASDMDEGRLGAALMYLKRADRWLE